MDAEKISKALALLGQSSKRNTTNLPSIVTSFTETSLLDNPRGFKMQVLSLDETSLAHIILEHKPKSLARQVKEQGSERVIDLISILILEVLEWYNVKNSMNESQILDAAYLVYNEFKRFNLYDLGLCFKRGKTGKYGKVYDRIDGGVLFEWLHKYDIDRTGNIVTIRQNEDATHKQAFRERSSEITLKDFLKRD